MSDFAVSQPNYAPQAPYGLGYLNTNPSIIHNPEIKDHLTYNFNHSLEKTACFVEFFMDRKLHQAQEEIAEAIDSEMYDVITINIGRRGGKTEVMGGVGPKFCSKYRGFSVLVVAPVYNQAKTMYKKIKRGLESNKESRQLVKPKKEGFKESPFPLITFYNGSTIEFKSAETPDNLRSEGYDLIIVDEAAFVDDEIISAVLEPMLMDSGGILVKISTPWGTGNHFYDSYIKGELQAKMLEEGEGIPEDELRYKSFKFPSWVNPYLSKRFLMGKKKDLGEDNPVWLQEYCAEFIEDDTTVFSTAHVQACLSDAFETHYKTENLIYLIDEGERNKEYVIGLDLAKHNDYTVFIVLDITTGPPYTLVYFERFNGIDYTDIAEKHLALSEAFNDAPACVDQTGIGEAYMDIAKKVGLDNLTGFKFTNESKTEIITKLSTSFRNKEVVMPKIRVLLTELKAFMRFRTKTTFKLEARSGFHDDTVCAFALAMHGVENCTSGVGSIAFIGAYS
uniref:Terminase large subunit gp17-like C-terminal domain-containing protein n=1 Tax=Methanococcus maripaludis (strain C6 / ATCC BAA-1332) TaxID=444158 RepID=A9A7H2_METM6